MAAIAAGLPLAGFVYSVARDTRLFQALAVGAYITLVSAGLLMLDTLGLFALPWDLDGGWQKRDRLVSIGAVVLVVAGVVLGIHEQNRAYGARGSAVHQANSDVAKAASNSKNINSLSTATDTRDTAVDTSAEQPTEPPTTAPPCPGNRPTATVTKMVATSDPTYPTVWRVELTVRVADRTIAPVKYLGFMVDYFDGLGKKLDTKYVRQSGDLAPHGKDSFDDPEVVTSDTQPARAVLTDMTYSWDTPGYVSCPQ
jgi:hypothetical protein